MLGIGAITNIALALKKEPKIINKIEIIWLGGNELDYKDNLEYNFKQDIEAVKIVFETKEINCPNIREDTSYEPTNNKHTITLVSKLDRNKIYNDLFEKLRGNDENK